MLKKILFLIVLTTTQNSILSMQNEGLSKKALEGNLESDVTYMFKNVSKLNKSEKYLADALERATQTYGIVEPTIIVKVLDKPTPGMHHSKALSYAMGDDKTGMEVHYIENFSGSANKHGYCVFYNPNASSKINNLNDIRLNDKNYTKHKNIATLYHELAHIYHGDCKPVNQFKENKKKWVIRGLFWGLTLIGFYGTYKSNQGSAAEKFCLLATPLMLLVGEYKALEESRSKEALADKISYQKLLANNEVLPVIASFFYFLEIYKSFWLIELLPDTSSQPNIKYRARIALNELQNAGHDLLALPIPARYAKVFNQELKSYFPDIYQRCIDEYAKLA